MATTAFVAVASYGRHENSSLIATPPGGLAIGLVYQPFYSYCIVPDSRYGRVYKTFLIASKSDCYRAPRV